MASQSSGSGTVILIGAALIGGAYLFLWRYDHMTIQGRVGNHPVSDALGIRKEARPLSTMARSLPAFISERDKSATRSRVTGTGIWTYVIVTNRGTYTLADASLAGNTRLDLSLRQQWSRTLSRLGYYNPTNKPPHMQIESFAITTPEGSKFLISSDKAVAQELVNIASIVACEEFQCDPGLLMNVRRDTLGYAVLFSGLSERLSLNDKLRLSCDEDPHVRIFAGEMLASLLPRFPTTGAAGSFKATSYRGMVTKLSRKVPLPQREKEFHALVNVPTAVR